MLALNDGTFTDGQIDAFVSTCSALTEAQAGIRIEISERMQIKPEKQRFGDPLMLFRIAGKAWEKRDAFDIAVGFLRRDELSFVAGMVDPYFSRYILIRGLDCNVFLHELFHAFLLGHSTRWVMRPTIPAGNYQWGWLMPEQRKELLKSKWRDFKELPGVGDEKERKKKEYEFYLAVGIVYYLEEDYTRAISFHTRSIELIPDEAGGFLVRGETYQKMGRHDLAMSDYNKAVEVEPRNAMAYFTRGSAHTEKGRHEEALSNYTKAIEIDPKHAEAYLRRGMAHYETERYRESVLDCNNAIGNGLKNRERAYLQRGMALHGLEKFDEAISDYTKAIDIDPKGIEAYLHRGLARQAKGKYREATWDFNGALRIDPKKTEAYAHRGNGYVRMEQYEKAISDFKKAIELDPNFADAYSGLAWLLATAKKKTILDGQKAVELATRACELTDWKNPTHLESLAAAHARTGDFDAAIKWQEKAFEQFKTRTKPDARERLDLYRSRKTWTMN